MSGMLSVVGTPIGNLDDLSPRAARALAAADVIACEDTRVARKLLTRVPSLAGLESERVRAQLVSYHARNEVRRGPEIVDRIRGGARVALTTDAGMPGVSDPGQRLVARCAEAGLRVEIIPGPSAVPAALIASGFPSARFVFEGFLPRSGSARRRRLEALAAEERTVVLFESPHRLAATLGALAAALGPRNAVVARELTKVHEEVVRGTLDALATRAESAAFKGEMTIVIEGASRDEVAPEPEALAEAVARAIETGMTKKEAIAAVAVSSEVPKRAVYQAVLDHPSG